MLDYIRRNQLVVLEQVLPQHPDMARLHPSSVNTMRILTDLVEGRSMWLHQRKDGPGRWVLRQLRAGGCPVPGGPGDPFGVKGEMLP